MHTHIVETVTFTYEWQNGGAQCPTKVLTILYGDLFQKI